MKPDLLDKVSQFAKQFPCIRFKKGENILRPGQKLSDIYFTKSGLCRVYTITSEGEEITIAQFKPLYVLSLVYTISKEPCPYFVEALTDVCCYQIPLNRHWEFLNNTSENMFLHLEYMTNQFSSLLSFSATLTVGNSLNKIASSLLMLLKYYGSVHENTGSINFHVTHKMLASLTGITRETVTIQMGKLEHQGIIKTSGKALYILDLEKLQELASTR